MKPAIDGSDKVYFPMTRLIKASLLLFFFALCASAVVVTHQVRSQVPPPVPHQLFVVVEHHLAAFRAADYTNAYREASSGVQQKFTPPQYEAMIRQDYGDMTEAPRIEFGFVKVDGASAVVQVFFRAANGSGRAFLYSLIAEGNSWKINGVRPMQPATRGLHV